ncbi:translation initiation factor IF3-1, mitochondrial [Lactuca sativa]|uniref:translation initiation factor IF3-1, mitochondrial n=1 Tax=Lactuca sativa TaxID=4236 RepID=UPI000CD86DBA|nr:translation initiation factor IF3-1, mitochondrial [Lactuca sativa]
MVMFWCRTKQSQLRALSNQFKRCYFQIHGSSSIIRGTTVGVLKSPNSAFHRTGSEFGNCVRFFAAPVQVKPKYEDKDKGRPRMNEQISAQYVRIVTDEGHGVVSRHEALERARRLNVDLVEVQPDGNPPVCKLMDYNREMYLRQAKEKEQTKKKSDLVLRKGGLKEVRITSKIDKNDLQTKADAIKRLAERGHRIKCMAVGTEDQDLGGLLSRLSALIDDFSLVESGPRVESKQAYVVVRHVKFGPLKKGPGKKKLLATSNTETPEQNESGSETEEDTLSQDPIESVGDFENKNYDDTMKFAPETSSNRYASATRPANVNVPENRYATPGAGGVRRRLEPESGGNRRQGGSEPEAASRPVEVNRYKKGPTPQPPPPPPDYQMNRGPRGDFREKQAGFRR